MRQTDDQLRELARGLIDGTFILADVTKREWIGSLALLLGGLPEQDFAKIGLILVPMAEHAHLYWVNGIAPGCTFSARIIHVNDMERFHSIVEPMYQAVYGDE